jgi:isoleucyl-tRNA synthetase
MYLDVSKDRLYTNKAASPARRSRQTAMFTILKAMTQLLAPILTFTAEEVWAAMPGWKDKEVSVHMTQFPQLNNQYFNAELGERWKTMIEAKAEITKAIEQARKEKVIGHSLDARVSILPSSSLRAFFSGHLEDLRALLIVSQLRLVEKQEVANPYSSEEFKGLTVGVDKAPGVKCDRCWIYAPSVGSDKDHPSICDRCLNNL